MVVDYDCYDLTTNNEVILEILRRLKSSDVIELKIMSPLESYYDKKNLETYSLDINQIFEASKHLFNKLECFVVGANVISLHEFDRIPNFENVKQTVVLFMEQIFTGVENLANYIHLQKRLIKLKDERKVSEDDTLVAKMVSVRSNEEVLELFK